MSQARASTDARESIPRRVARIPDYVKCALLLALWLVPMTYTGLTYRNLPGFPTYFTYMHHVSCLFTGRVSFWPNYYYEVRLQGQTEFIDVPEKQIAAMWVFGYRSRVNRTLVEARGEERIERTKRRIARFIKRRYEKLHPEAPPVVAVRMRRADYRTDDPTMMHPAGRWQRPALAEVEPFRLRVIHLQNFEP